MVAEETAAGKVRTKPPYRRPVWYETFFGILQGRKLEKIDLDFVKNNITSGNADNAYIFLSGLKFLKLINDDGLVTPKLDKLRLQGEQFTKNLETIIREAYSEVFDKVVVESVQQQVLVNFFIEKYGYASGTSGEAVRLFVYFASKSGIKLSAELESNLEVGGSKQRQNNTPERAKKKQIIQSDSTPRDNADDSRTERIAGPKGIQANITMVLDKDTPEEIWKMVLRLLGSDE